jgi:hypothetical protein
LAILLFERDMGREAQGNIGVQTECDSGTSFIWCFEELWNRLHVSLASKGGSNMYQILENGGTCREEMGVGYVKIIREDTGVEIRERPF